MKILVSLLFVCGLALADYNQQPNHHGWPFTPSQRSAQNAQHSRHGFHQSGWGQTHNQAMGWQTPNWQQNRQPKMSFREKKLAGLPVKLANVFGYETEQPFYYNSGIKPDHKVGIKVSMFVRMLGPICTKYNVMDMQVTFRETYYDKRLKNLVESFGANDFVTLAGDDVSMIWTPDTFFRHSTEEKYMGSIKPNVYARIYPDGKILISRRISLKLACPHLEKKLAANQSANCTMEIASYGYQMEDLFYMPDGTEPMKMTDMATTFLGKFNELPISYEGHRVEEETVETSTGKYSVLKFHFTFMAKNR